MKTIKFYRTGDAYGCFSNFSAHSITIDRVEWRTSEHYFQAMKFLDPKLQNKAREINSPMDVARFGRDRSLPLRPDWDIVKDDIMGQAVFAKVIQNQEMFDTLLSTGNDHLVEHTQNDFYWADGGDGTGKNMLGIILMEVREAIKRAMGNVEVIQGDITNLNVDAIVNAANKSLTGGGGVDGAIHRAAGPELKTYCAKFKGCKTGEARVSSGYGLHAQYIIHAVGPVWFEGEKNEDEKLYSAYRNSMIIAEEVKAKVVAFPNISTGAFRFPFDRATVIQRFSIVSFLMQTDVIEEVKVVCFSEKDIQRVERKYLILRNNEKSI